MLCLSLGICPRDYLSSKPLTRMCNGPIFTGTVNLETRRRRGISFGPQLLYYWRNRPIYPLVSQVGLSAGIHAFQKAKSLLSLPGIEVDSIIQIQRPHYKGNYLARKRDVFRHFCHRGKHTQLQTWTGP